MPSELHQVLLADLFHALMHNLEHLDAILEIISQLQIRLTDGPTRHTQQRLTRPLMEPINRTTINQRREHSESRSEHLPERAHRDD